jgi:hypothetical protein
MLPVEMSISLGLSLQRIAKQGLSPLASALEAVYTRRWLAAIWKAAPPAMAAKALTQLA